VGEGEVKWHNTKNTHSHHIHFITSRL